MAFTWIMILILSVFYAMPALSAAASQRNLYQFKNMINHKGYSAFDYNGYGCWCGAGSYGPRTLDATDDCCRIHDNCYGTVQDGWFACSPKFVTYAWQGLPDKVIECTDTPDTCDRKTCECDKAAADCFDNHRSTFQSSFLTKTNDQLYESCNIPE